MKIRGRHIQNGEQVEVSLADGLIESVIPIIVNEPLPWVSPGWIDLQVNGFGGHDLNGEKTAVADVVGLTNGLLARGVTTYFPTVITGSFERILQAMTAIREACEQHWTVAQAVAGIHLEGPYLSAADGPRGAHDKAYIRPPDWEEFTRWQEASGHRIRIVTLAPEQEGALPFIRKLVSTGVKVSIGHTMADAQTIEQAADAGAALSTHLGNGAHPMLPRHPNYIWDQLAEDRLWATFIADGHHLPRNVLKAMLRAKLGKSILVSDSVMFGGLPAGRYRSTIGAEVALTADGRLHTVENPLILAGSAQSLDQGLTNMLRWGDLTMPEAIGLVTKNPAEAAGLPMFGTLAPGYAANLVLFDVEQKEKTIKIKETVLSGRSVLS